MLKRTLRNQTNKQNRELYSLVVDEDVKKLNKKKRERNKTESYVAYLLKRTLRNQTNKQNRELCGLVVEEDVKEPNKQTKPRVMWPSC